MLEEVKGPDCDGSTSISFFLPGFLLIDSEHMFMTPDNSVYAEIQKSEKKVSKIFPRAAISLMRMSPQSNGQPNDSIEGVDPQIVFARHQRWLRTLVIARTGNRDAVDEILQEIALAFFGSDSRPSKLDGIAPWLYRVAIRQVMLLRRKNGRRMKLANRFVEQTSPVETDSRSLNPLDWLLSSERRERVKLALKELAARDREILLLKYTENWSYRELAATLGVTIPAIETRLHRARGRLRSILERMQISE